jgi:hypothetical protein
VTDPSTGCTGPSPAGAAPAGRGRAHPTGRSGQLRRRRAASPGSRRPGAPMLLTAAAARTGTTRLISAVTVLGASEPLRVLQQVAALHLIPAGPDRPGRRRRLVHRSLPLLARPDRRRPVVHRDIRVAAPDPRHPKDTWSGRHRPPKPGQGVSPDRCKPTTDLGPCRRRPGFRPSRRPRAAIDARYHHWPARPVPFALRALPARLADCASAATRTLTGSSGQSAV